MAEDKFIQEISEQIPALISACVRSCCTADQGLALFDPLPFHFNPRLQPFPKPLQNAFFRRNKRSQHFVRANSLHSTSLIEAVLERRKFPGLHTLNCWKVPQAQALAVNWSRYCEEGLNTPTNKSQWQRSHISSKTSLESGLPSCKGDLLTIISLAGLKWNGC